MAGGGGAPLAVSSKTKLVLRKKGLAKGVQVQVQFHIFRIVPHSGLVFDSRTCVAKTATADKRSKLDQ